MGCWMDLCIYQRDEECILEEPPQIDNMGMCTDCIIVSLPKEILEPAKERQLRLYEADALPFPGPPDTGG